MTLLPESGTGLQDEPVSARVRSTTAPVACTALPAGPIRVLALTKSTGGLRAYHRTLVAGLSDSRFAVHTLCLSDDAKAFADELSALGHTAEAMPMARYRLALLGDLRVAFRARKSARSHRAEVILCHGSKAGILGRIVGRTLGIPVVACQASLPFLPQVQGRKARSFRWIERAAKRLGGHVVSLTEAARTASLAHGIAAPDRISVIRTGIDPPLPAPETARHRIRQDLGIGADSPIVLWAGRFEPQKAPAIFLEAATRLCDRHPDAHVLMVGEGSRAASLAADLTGNRHRTRIRLLPWRSDLAALMATADLFALSSRWEGLPLVLLEAMAMGAVPVATAIDGCTEVIEEGRSGRLVPVDDARAMADALADCLADRGRLAAMSAAAKDRVRQHFPASRMIADWEALLVTLSGRGTT